MNLGRQQGLIHVVTHQFQLWMVAQQPGERVGGSFQSAPVIARQSHLYGIRLGSIVKLLETYIGIGKGFFIFRFILSKNFLGSLRRYSIDNELRVISAPKLGSIDSVEAGGGSALERRYRNDAVIIVQDALKRVG